MGQQQSSDNILQEKESTSTMDSIEVTECENEKCLEVRRRLHDKLHSVISQMRIKESGLELRERDCRNIEVSTMKYLSMKRRLFLLEHGMRRVPEESDIDM